MLKRAHSAFLDECVGVEERRERERGRREDEDEVGDEVVSEDEDMEDEEE